jgi:hypothetical protein
LLPPEISGTQQVVATHAPCCRPTVRSCHIQIGSTGQKANSKEKPEMSELPTAMLPLDDAIEPTSHTETVLKTPLPLAGVEVKPAPTLITEQEVRFATAAAVRPPTTRWWTRATHVLAGTARRMFVTTSAESRPPRRHYPRQYDFIEDARMAREMDRL